MSNPLAERQQRAAMLQPTATPGADPLISPERADAESDITQAGMDATLEASFPASDPPSWTAAIATPAPVQPLRAEPALQRWLQRVAACF